jgi:nitrogen fixation/metabolism regulation signal transduction histidine kinase
LIGGLAWLALYFVTILHLYIGALVVAGATLTIAADLRRTIDAVGRLANRDLERVLIASSGPPRIQSPSGKDPGASIETVITALQLDRRQRRLEIESLEALLNTVEAALVVVKGGGRAQLVNRAAHDLAGKSIGYLRDITALGPATIDQIIHLNPGERKIVTLADGRRMFVSAAGLSVPGKDLERLISLQGISGQLDAVELNAWQSMARVLAHEIMNSLTPIASLSEGLEILLRKNSNNQFSNETPSVNGELLLSLETITRRSRGLMDFVARYRAMADLPAAKCRAVLLDEALADIARLLAAPWSARGIHYTSNVDPAGLRVRADPELLAQALLNLLRNAIDAVSDTTHPRISLTCRQVDGKVVIEVSDNGPGVAEELREQVFVPFFTTKSEGFGIGLSLARQIALAHGGKLELANRESGGCVFTLTLPDMPLNNETDNNRLATSP